MTASIHPLRVLVIRPDRLGDVILSTPVFEAIRQKYPQATVKVLLQGNVAPVIQGIPSVDSCMVYDPAGRHSGFEGFRRLCSEIRQEKFDIAVSLTSERKIAAAVFYAGIPRRVGPLSKPHSYFFYNEGIRQRRSRVEMHEADYNLQLLKKIDIAVESRALPTQVYLDQAVRGLSAAWLKEKGWDCAALDRKSLVVVHPGMGGSALNWPETHYLKLIENLIQEGVQILLSFGPAEDELAERLLHGLGEFREKVISYRSGKDRGLEFLAGLYSYADLVVAPSTGPLHLAVALKRRVLTFYPSIRVQSVDRWGPYQKDESRASVLSSGGTSLQSMAEISVQQAFEFAKDQLLKERNHHD